VQGDPNAPSLFLPQLGSRGKADLLMISDILSVTAYFLEACWDDYLWHLAPSSPLPLVLAYDTQPSYFCQ